MDLIQLIELIKNFLVMNDAGLSINISIELNTGKEEEKE